MSAISKLIDSCQNGAFFDLYHIIVSWALVDFQSKSHIFWSYQLASLLIVCLISLFVSNLYGLYSGLSLGYHCNHYNLLLILIIYLFDENSLGIGFLKHFTTLYTLFFLAHCQQMPLLQILKWSVSMTSSAS